MLKVGRRAPDFDLPTTRGAGREQARVSLADFDDRWLALVFYPRDFSLVCPTELTALSARVGDFDQRHCCLLGVSTDTLDTHDRWIATPVTQGGLGGLEFPLASDTDGVAATAYGVYQERQGICLRGLFIIDPNGVLQYQAVNSMAVGRRADDVLRVLAALDSGGMCPADWQPDTAPLDAAAALRPGSMFANYRIASELGTGSFGTVFRALDTTLDRIVALKVFKAANAQRWDTALYEARAAAALHHPNVCAVYAVDSSEGTPGIAMEYVDGPTLRELLDAGPLSGDQVVRLAQQMASGLAAAHAARISHGDLKPANVMVTEDEVVKIMDFGLARRAPKPEPTTTAGPADATLLAAPETNANADATVALPAEDSFIAGTPAYMAPEMTRGVPATSASDTFAYGVIVREMSTGERLFRGDDPLEVFQQINRVDPEAAAADLPPGLAGIVRAALARNPDERPAMAEFEAHFASRESSV